MTGRLPKHGSNRKFQNESEESPGNSQKIKETTSFNLWQNRIKIVKTLLNQANKDSLIARLRQRVCSVNKAGNKSLVSFARPVR
jgi:hypothetical protein